MLNLGTGELLVIFLVALLVLGPSKLPDAARQAGKAMAELRRLSNGFQSEMRAAMRDPVPTLPPLPEEAALPPSPIEDDEPKRPRKRREPLRADGAISAEQQLRD